MSEAEGLDSFHNLHYLFCRGYRNKHIYAEGTPSENMMIIELLKLISFHNAELNRSVPVGQNNRQEPQLA